MARFSPSAPTLPLDQVLDVPSLKILNAAIRIAELMNCDESVWNPFFKRTLDSSSLPNLALIPANLIPTEAQRTIPHHPLIDILPWASVRTKLTYVFAMPPHLRPCTARDPLAVLQIAFDLDDLKEGCRVVGGNGLGEEDWEIGEAFLKHWWWALDRHVIENTNRLRALRGAERLKIDAVEAIG